MKRFLNLALLFAIILPTLLVSGCSVGASPNTSPDMKMGSVSLLPAEMQSAPTRVREAYQFAMAHADALKDVPCYCGCGAMGHTSNYSCFIKKANDDGTFAFDSHALGCSLCVDIAQDVMRLTRENKSPLQIRETIVASYSQFGPPNQ